jgi:acetyl esterase/lipase
MGLVSSFKCAGPFMPIPGKQLVDPELLPLLAFFPPLELSDAALPMIRLQGIPGAAHDDPETGAAIIARRMIPGPRNAPDVAVTIYSPPVRSDTMPCILYMHGGGFVIGSAAAMRTTHVKLAVAAECLIVAVDYRLAPETRFPGAIEDCYAALSWLFAEARALGIDAQRVGVMGESAGGGLAAALALMARDRGEHALAFQHLIYPMLDDRTAASIDPHPYAGEFLWTPVNNAFGWQALLGVPPGSPGVSPYASPARAEDLSGLPPTFISTGALDLFIDEDIDYARRLIRHGVPVELHVHPGAFHGFDLSADARVAATARRESLDALRRSLGRSRERRA